MDIKGNLKTMTDNITDPKVVTDYLATLGKWVAGIVMATVGVLFWLSENYTSKAYAEDMKKEFKTADESVMMAVVRADENLSQQIAELAAEARRSNELLMVQIEKGRLSKVLADIRENDNAQFNIGQFVAVNGDNEQATRRLRQLKSEREDLVMRRECIIDKNPVCD